MLAHGQSGRPVQTRDKAEQKHQTPGEARKAAQEKGFGAVSLKFFLINFYLTNIQKYYLHRVVSIKN